MRTRPSRSSPRRGAWRAGTRVLALGVLVASSASAQPPGAPRDSAPDRRPTVAIFDFTNGALLDHDRYEPLRWSLAEALGDVLATNPGIRIVERDRLRQVLAEQGFSGSGRIDSATAVRVGAVLGVHHLVFGGFMIQPKDRLMKITMRSVNTETAQWEYSTSAIRSADRLFELIDELGARINAGLRLPPLPMRPAPRASVRREQRDWLQALVVQGYASAAEDRGDVATAIEYYRKALQLAPELARARARLAALEAGAPVRPRDVP